MSQGHPVTGTSRPPLPASGGITFGVKLLLIGGIALAAMQGFFVTGSSGFGRVWPAEASAKIDLPPAHLGP